MDVLKLIEEIEKDLAELKRQAASSDDSEINWDKMIGRLVMVRDFATDEWRGPVVFQKIDEDGSFDTSMSIWEQAKPYTGPTRPNWIEWSGGEQPVADSMQAIVQLKNGALVCNTAHHFNWTGSDSPLSIARYTVIEP